ncbi:unnamed protein product [Diatraea saccharalis]|uniref:Uncharacterized protein n=1 Tax=Diatraea saccharalis TaxID=40085 RepID=A0A9N9R6K8_9NEOP|nr:unnamed protein product [Diatraea saccharalis]
MFKVPWLGLFSSQAYCYVLLQVSKDEQNRSNVDALIHKVVPSEQYDKLAAKITRKQFPTLQEQEKLEQNPEPIFKSHNVKGEKKDEHSDIIQTIKDIFSDKPALRTGSLQIAPEVINFRSNKPTLLYEVSSDLLVQIIKEILSSKKLAQYTDEIVRRAAVVYKTIKDK